jgi:hypothetical protein
LRKPRFASVTAQLIVRKGEASPSVIAPVALPQPDTIEPANANLRLVSTPRGQSAIKPWGVTVTLPTTEPETLGYFAVKRNVTPRALSHFVEEGCGNVVIVPIAVAPNFDRSVTVSLLDSTESFTHDVTAGGWTGDAGSFLTGGPDLFRDANGWCVTITMHESRPPLLEMRQGPRCEVLLLDGLPAAAIS